MNKEDKIFILFLFFIISILYFNTLKAGFIMDDNIFIKNNERIRQEKDITNFFKEGYWSYAGEIRDYDYYRPLVLLSFYSDFKVYGNYYPGFRISNILFFFLFSVFFYLFIRKILKLNLKVSIVATLMMAMNPLHSENIAWIVGRNDTLYLMWGLGFLYFGGKYLKNNNISSLFISYLFFILGIFTKETFLLFFPILFLLDFLILNRKKILYHLSFLIPIFFYYAIRGAVIEHTFIFYDYKPLYTALYKIIAAFGFYNKNLLFPLYFEKLMEIRNLKIIFPFFVLGIIFVLIYILILFLLIKKGKKIELFSFIFSAIFTGFTSLLVLRYFFPAVTRYLPAAIPGFAIFAAIYFEKFKYKHKYILLAIILFLFSIQIVWNNSLFYSEEQYLNYMVKRIPSSTYQKIGLCRIKIDKNQYFEAIKLLNSINNENILRLNKILIALHKSRIAVKLARYDFALESLKKGNKYIGNRIEKSWILIHLTNILRRVGNYEKSIKLIDNYEKEFGHLYDLDIIKWEIRISLLNWDSALKLENYIKKQYGYFTGINTTLLKRKYDTMNNINKIKFYEKYLNYEKALNILELLKNKIELFEFELKKSELLFKLGNEKQALKIINSLTENCNNKKQLYFLSNFFINEIIRPKISVKALNKLKKISNSDLQSIDKKIEFLIRYSNLIKNLYSNR